MHQKPGMVPAILVAYRLLPVVRAVHSCQQMTAKMTVVDLSLTLAPLQGFFLIGFIVAVGYIGARTGLSGKETETVLNRLAFTFATPALLFSVIANADTTVLLSPIHLINWLGIGVVLFLTFGTLWTLHRTKKGTLNKQEFTLATVSTVWVNSNNIGLPLGIYVLGDAGFIAPVILWQWLIIVPVTMMVLNRFITGKSSFQEALTVVLRNPLVIASILGLIVSLSHWDTPTFISMPIDLLGSAAIPLTLLAFGIGIGITRQPAEDSPRFRGFWVVVVLKAVVLPAIVFIAASQIFGLTGLELFAVTLVAALPTAHSVYVTSTEQRVLLGPARDIVLVTTFASVPIILIASVLSGPLGYV